VYAAKPDPTPYVALRPQVPLAEVNPGNTAVARLTSRLDLTAADRADESLFNRILWRMIKGARRPMPPPQHAVAALPGIRRMELSAPVARQVAIGQSSHLSIGRHSEAQRAIPELPPN